MKKNYYTPEDSPSQPILNITKKIYTINGTICGNMITSSVNMFE